MSGRDPPLTLAQQLDWANMQMDTAMVMLTKSGLRDGSPEADLVEMMSAIVLSLREHKEAMAQLRKWHDAWISEKTNVPLLQTEVLLKRAEGVA